MLRVALRHLLQRAAAPNRSLRPRSHSRLFSTFSSEDEDNAFSDGLPEIRERILLLTEKLPQPRHHIPPHILPTISALAFELLSSPSPSPPPLDSLLSSSPHGAAFVELLSLLSPNPLLALQVFIWRTQLAAQHPMHPEEYSKAIALAGRARDCRLAFELFHAAASCGLRTVSIYNALMAAYLFNDETKRALAVFGRLKRDLDPTIVTYNILLSLFGRSYLIDRMERVLLTIRSKPDTLRPNISTYSTLIAVYLIVAEWEKMEAVFQEMEDGSVKPDMNTYSLMLRGFANAGNLEKMEKMYGLARDHVHEHEVCLLRLMICAYFASSEPDRITKIEDLLRHIPEDQYRPWLDLLLIRMYAREGLMEKMEAMIQQAFEHGTVVWKVGTMKSIITSYFMSDAVDRLAVFVRRAELAGWRMCRSVYHCKMVMYGRHRRFLDMLGVLSEMEAFNLDPCKKTFWIMYHAYSRIGESLHAEGVLGLMCKHGFEIPNKAIV